MHTCLTTAEQLTADWDNRINFQLDPASLPIAFDFPSNEAIAEALLASPNVVAITGTMHEQLETRNIAGQMRGMGLAALLETSFQLSHFDLREFDVPGGILHGFGERVYQPWCRFLIDLGFTWDRCYPIMRLSGPRTVTGYHMDASNVLFWNVRGQKRFHGLKEPDHWAPLDWAVQPGNNRAPKPPGIGPADVLSHIMTDNTFLWNHLLTPHWVDADAITFGINISHGGLRHRGRLCRYEAALYEHQAPSDFRYKGY